MEYAYFNRFTLTMTLDEAQTASHQGACDDDVKWLRNQLHIARQLDALVPADLLAELKEYGAWDVEELAEHEDNIQRILWIVGGNIIDEVGERTR